MIVPQYWAEGRAQHRQRGKQVTVRRFGWSDESETEAQANADARANEALQRVLAGEKLARREPKISYNGATGVPIREEIVERHGETIITRNAYGARCLNTPNVLFADVDFDETAPNKLTGLVAAALTLVALIVGVLTKSWMWGIGTGFVLLCCTNLIANRLQRRRLNASGGAEAASMTRIERFIAANPAWALRLYRTPAGLRVLVTHRTFETDDLQVREFFDAIGVDPVYARMCANQKCFRARVSAKPWRIGIGAHMRPRPGVWPVDASRLALRHTWIEKYEAAAQSYAACVFMRAAGSGTASFATREVQTLHDDLCRATAKLPIA